LESIKLYKNYYVKPNSFEMSLAFLLLGQDPVFRWSFLCSEKRNGGKKNKTPAGDENEKKTKKSHKKKNNDCLFHGTNSMCYYS